MPQLLLLCLLLLAACAAPPRKKDPDPAAPPARLILLVLKHERLLQPYAADTPDGPLRPLPPYPVLAASGAIGPKLRQGDLQVPEGFYRVESLNPQSRFHLALRLDYPNAEDRLRALQDHRDPATLGGDIMIHGSDQSVGCVALGDPAIERLYQLVSATGLPNVEIIISPCDFRLRDLPPQATAHLPPWVPGLHQRLRTFIRALPQAPNTNH